MFIQLTNINYSSPRKMIIDVDRIVSVLEYGETGENAAVTYCADGNVYQVPVEESVDEIIEKLEDIEGEVFV